MPTEEYVARLIAEIERLKSEADRLQKLAEDLSGIICDANTAENQLRAELADTDRRIALLTRDNQYWRERFAREVKDG